MLEIPVCERTVYDVLCALDRIFSPGTTRFSDYVKNTSDDHGFLRTAYARKSLPIENRSIPSWVTHIVVGSNKNAYDTPLNCELVGGLGRYERTLSKFQICFVDKQGVAGEVAWNQECGYPINYIIQITLIGVETGR